MIKTHKRKYTRKRCFLTRIIDVHTHACSDANREHFLEEMKANGITMAITSSLGVNDWPDTPDAETIRAANAQAMRLAEFSGGRILWLAYINPQLDSAAAELERCAKEGCRGVKLWVTVRDAVTGSMDKVPPILRQASALRLPVKIHTFHRMGGNFPGEASVEDVAGLARECPMSTIIAAHAGCNWHQTEGILNDVPNVSVDISGGMPEDGMVENLVSWLGIRRVLYGSDALGRSFASQIAKVTCSSLNAKQREAVLFKNAASIFRITQREILRAIQAAEKTQPSPALSFDFDGDDHSFLLGQLPHGLVPEQDGRKLKWKIRRMGYKKIYATNAESIYACNLQTVNKIFKDKCAKWKNVMPLASIYPLAYNWRETLRDAAKNFTGAVVFPYCHNWNLASPELRPFFEMAAELKLPLWVSTVIYDYRFRHAGVEPRPVSHDDVISFLRNAPQNAYVFLGLPPATVSDALALGRNDVRFEISRMLDTTDGVRSVAQQYGTDKLLFGSEFPIRNILTNYSILDAATHGALSMPRKSK